LVPAWTDEIIEIRTRSCYVLTVQPGDQKRGVNVSHQPLNRDGSHKSVPLRGLSPERRWSPKKVDGYEHRSRYGCAEKAPVSPRHPAR
jgi:hypothetical protein